MTHYSFMNAQQKTLTRRLPIQFIAYHFHLRILHSGMTAEQVLALPPAKFGLFVGQACEVNRDAALVPYNRDFTISPLLTMTGAMNIGLRDTEDMVSPRPSSFPVAFFAHLTRVDAGVPVRRQPVPRTDPAPAHESQHPSQCHHPTDLQDHAGFRQ